MGFFGNVIGGALGKIGSKILPIPGVDGERLGGWLGGLAPFRAGGKIKAYEKGGRVPRGTRGFRKGGKVKKMTKARHKTVQSQFQLKPI